MPTIFVDVVLSWSQWNDFSVQNTCFTRYTINPRSLKSKIILNLVMEFEDILMWKSNTLDVISGQHSIKPSIGSLKNGKCAIKIGFW